MTRNLHDREEWHTGEFFATLVGLSSSISTHPTDTLVEDVLRDLHERLVAIEPRYGLGRFTVDAEIAEAALGFTIDAVIDAGEAFSSTLGELTLGESTLGD